MPERWTRRAFVAAAAASAGGALLPGRETGLGGTYEVRWRGDDVLGVRPNTDRCPFYPDGPPPVR